MTQEWQSMQLESVLGDAQEYTCSVAEIKEKSSLREPPFAFGSGERTLTFTPSSPPRECTCKLARNVVSFINTR